MLQPTAERCQRRTSLTYQGIEDRWLHDKDYRIKRIASNYCADQDVARHRDCQAAMFFQDNYTDPYSEEASVVTLLTSARDRIKKTAQRIQAEQSAIALAREVAKSTAEVRPELPRGDYDLILKEFKSENPGCEKSDWFIEFKKAFERMRILRKEDQEARAEQARLKGEKRRARLMTELMTPMTEPMSSSSSKKEERGEEIPQTPPRRTIWKCYKCKKEANEHSICSFCNRVCCHCC